MKILQLTAHYSPNVGGVETHLIDLVTYLQKNKYEVTVLAYQPLVTKAKWKMHEKEKNLEIIRIPWIAGFFYSFVSHPAMEFIYLVPGLFIATPFILLSKKIHVIHAHGLVAGFVGVFWAKVLRKRVIISVHNIYHFPKAGTYAQFVRWIFGHADCVLCLSKQSAKEVISLGIGEDKVKVFTYWIDLDIFKKIKNAKQILGWDKNFVVLFVGRLIPEKGGRELLKAAANLDKNITVAIAGVGPLEEEIKKQQVKSKIINFLGKIDNKSLPLYYSAADVLIVPSVHEEGFGRVLLESLACDTPIIASNRGAIPEAVDKSVALLIDINPKNIVQSINYLFSHSEKLRKMSSKARNFTQERYSEKNTIVITKSYASK